MEPASLDVTDWKNSVSAEKRLQFINNLIQAMTTLTKTNATNEELLKHATDLENNIYEKAVCRADYYNQIAQQIYKITEQIKSSPAAEFEDLFANLNLNEMTFEDNENITDFHLASGSNTMEDSGESITFQHVKVWFMLLHAFECLMNNNEECVIANCNKFRIVLTHLITCRDDTNCNDYLCNSSRVLITHWTNCEEEDCMLCTKVNDLKKPADPSIQKDWHKTCTFELREQLINKLTQAMCLAPALVVDFMRKIEKEIYETADSRSDYYILFTKKLSELHKQRQLSIVVR